MRKLFVFLFVAGLFVVQNTYAQDTKTETDKVTKTATVKEFNTLELTPNTEVALNRATKLTEDLNTAVNLTSAQSTQVKQVYLKSEQKLEELRANRLKNRNFSREIRSLHLSTEAQIKDILTNRQVRKYNDYKAKIAEMRSSN